MIVFFILPPMIRGQYVRVYGEDRNERAYAISEGVFTLPSYRIPEYVLAGWTESYSPFRNPLVIGVNRLNGNFLWGLVATDTGEFRSIQNTTNGFVLTGYIKRGGNSDIMVAKVSTEGRFQWGRVYLASGDDIANSIIKTRDGGYAVCGWTNSFGPAPHPNIILLKVDSIGAPQWSRVYWLIPHIGDDRAFSMVELPFYPNYPMMRYAIVGRTQIRGRGNDDAFVITLDSLGYPLWARAVTAGNHDEAHSLVVSNDTLTVAGWTDGFNVNKDPDIFLWNIRIYDGTPIWRYTYGLSDFPEKVGGNRCLTLNLPSSAAPYRFLIVGWTAHTPAPAGGTDFQYLAVRRDGGLVWARRHPSFTNGTPHLEEAYQVLTSFNRIAIAGWSNNNVFTLGEDMHLLHTSLSGLNRICTARDTLIRSEFLDTTTICSSEVVSLPITSFSLDSICVPGRRLCWNLWEPWDQIPSPDISSKAVKSGGGIVALGNCLYLLVGNNTRGFGKFNMEEGSWSKEESVPLGPRNKKVKKGACMLGIQGTNGKGVEGEVYIFKGGGTNEFYKYTTGGKSWQSLPEPNFLKGVKGGFMAAVTVRDTTYIYAGSGYKNEWKRFNLQTGQWEKCIPETLPGGKWKIGSAMTSFLISEEKIINSNRILMMRAGSRENEVYIFNPQSEPPTFTRVASLPSESRGGKRRKIGEGASIVSIDEPNSPNFTFFAIKGKNTREFWKLEISSAQEDTGHWAQLEDVPSQKGIKGGGSLTYSLWNLGIYLTVGNNTNEIFVYYLPEETLFLSFPREPSAMGKTGKTSRMINISNPTRDLTTISYYLPKKETASLKIYNILGEIIYQSASDNGEFRIKKLPAGVYLLRFEAKGYQEDRKLIVVR
ncbi:MAG: T9SS type A sorting domain-containing protein [candidate division WOR-3 bacterium]